MYSIYVRGDNCVASAKSLGALVAQELYPDINCQSFEEFAQGYYINALLMFILCTHAVITPHNGFQTVMHSVMQSVPFQGAAIAPH